MPRIRSVHPGQWRDEDFVECSPLGRLLAIALRNEADDQGVFEWKPKTLKMNLLPADNTDMEELLAELERHNIIKGFEHKGRKFGAIRNFMDYQRPKKPNFVHFMPPEFRTYVMSKTKSTEPEPPDKGGSSTKGGNGSAEVGGRRKEVGDNPPKSPQGDYAFEGKVVRLKAGDFERWRQAFPNLDLRAELTALDDHYAANLAGAERKKWFQRCSSALAKKNAERKSAAPAEDRGGGKLGSELTDEERLAQENYIRGRNGKPPKDALGRILHDEPPVTEMPAHMRALSGSSGDQSSLDIPAPLDRRAAKGAH